MLLALSPNVARKGSCFPRSGRDRGRGGRFLSDSLITTREIRWNRPAAAASAGGRGYRSIRPSAALSRPARCRHRACSRCFPSSSVNGHARRPQISVLRCSAGEERANALPRCRPTDRQGKTGRKRKDVFMSASRCFFGLVKWKE